MYLSLNLIYIHKFLLQMTRHLWVRHNYTREGKVQFFWKKSVKYKFLVVDFRAFELDTA